MDILSWEIADVVSPCLPRFIRLFNKKNFVSVAVCRRIRESDDDVPRSEDQQEEDVGQVR